MGTKIDSARTGKAHEVASSRGAPRSPACAPGTSANAETEPATVVHDFTAPLTVNKTATAKTSNADHTPQTATPQTVAIADGEQTTAAETETTVMQTAATCTATATQTRASAAATAAPLVTLTDLLPGEIASALNLSPSFRGKQIFEWIYKGASSFDEMTNLSKELRRTSSQKARIYSTYVSKELIDPDGTIKLQITLSDGLCIETVLLTDSENRKTACVSCQIGCAMGCAFCQTGTLGFARNLSAGEIVEQFLHLEKKAGTLDNIVFMGMGEPMLNLGAIRKAIDILSSPNGRNLSKRRITLSTSGVISGIYDLAKNGPQLRLAVSLTTANEALRTSLMPVTKTNMLADLKKAIMFYTESTGTRCTLEAALMHGVNTDKKSADEMIAFASGMNAHFNLIPWNPVSSLPFTEPGTEETHAFVSMLEKSGISVTLRTRRGRKIGGACGQLGKSRAD